jgi:predicted transcriptional regulator
MSPVFPAASRHILIAVSSLAVAVVGAVTLKKFKLVPSESVEALDDT